MPILRNTVASIPDRRRRKNHEVPARLAFAAAAFFGVRFATADPAPALTVDSTQTQADVRPTNENAAAGPVRLHTVSAVRWGGPIDIRLYERDAAAAKQAAQKALTLAKEFDLVLSDYDPDSDLNRFCRAVREGVAAQDVALFEPFEVEASRRLLSLLGTVDKIGTRVPGGFVDPAIGPLTHLWRKARRLKRLPTEEQIATALASSGRNRLTFGPADDAAAASIRRLRPRLDEDANSGETVRLRVEAAPPDFQLDFGAVAKGLALEQMRSLLQREGFENFLIDAGGDIVCLGRVVDADGDVVRPWRVGIAPTVAVKSPPTQFLNLGTLEGSRTDLAVATSGDGAQALEFDGRRYSHIVDPRTGQPIERRMSVTVLANSGLAADALATAFNVAGPDGANALAEAIRGSSPHPLYVLIRIAWIDDAGREQQWFSAGEGRMSGEELYRMLRVEPAAGD